MVDYSEAIGLEGFEDIEGFELSAEEQKGIVGVCGIVAFANLLQPGGAPGYEPKYGIDLMAGKGSEDAALLFAVAKHVLTNKWGADSEREFDIASQLASGFSGRQINWSIKDGDLVDPEYNGGYWVLGAKNPDPVLILDAGGRVVTEAARFPGRNWAVRAFIELRASPSKDRLNVRLLAVQGIQAGARKVGRTADQTLALVQGAIAKLPPLPAVAGGAAQAAPSRAIAAPAAPAQPARRSPAQAQPSPAPAPARRRAAAQAQDPSQYFREPTSPAEVIEQAGAGGPADVQAAPPTRRRIARVE